MTNLLFGADRLNELTGETWTLIDRGDVRVYRCTHDHDIPMEGVDWAGERIMEFIKGVHDGYEAASTPAWDMAEANEASVRLGE